MLDVLLEEAVMDPFLLFKYIAFLFATAVRILGRKWVVRGLAVSTALTTLLIIKDSLG